MNKQTIYFLITLVIAIIWGYFADLKNGEVGWFIGRLLFMSFFVIFVSKLYRFIK
ncbi:hypothetical protein [Anaerobacillus alkalidiazotrophicus]|uniref:hypothetical protein n=1 Tax=Anaerobacillus alkalidiazotrophicus TaxID=472963 RepID=UPI0014716FA8|nr:hypothetical protein [Anaerobacillus alkalidiazotrophicus]